MADNASETSGISANPMASSGQVQPFFTMAGTGGSGLQIVSEKLSETNYASWAVAIELYVEGHDKLDILHGSKVKPDEKDPSFRTWRRDNIQLMTWILNSVSSGIKQVILHNKTAYDMWKRADEKYPEKKPEKFKHNAKKAPNSGNIAIQKLENEEIIGSSVPSTTGLFSTDIVNLQHLLSRLQASSSVSTPIQAHADHMTNAANSFISYSLSSGQEKVIIADGTKATVAGKGENTTSSFVPQVVPHVIPSPISLDVMENGKDAPSLGSQSLLDIITYKRRRHKQGPTVDRLVESDAPAPDPVKQLSSSVEPTAPRNMNELNLPIVVRKGVRKTDKILRNGRRKKESLKKGGKKRKRRNTSEELKQWQGRICLPQEPQRHGAPRLSSSSLQSPASNEATEEKGDRESQIEFDYSNNSAYFSGTMLMRMETFFRIAPATKRGDLVGKLRGRTCRLVKILKKYDKRTGALIRQPFIEKVLQQPFFTTDLLCKLVKECVAMLDHLFPSNNLSISAECDGQNRVPKPAQSGGRVLELEEIKYMQSLYMKSTVAALRSLKQIRSKSSTVKTD
ncbi:hypothetical protein ZIOFF_024224 [Zingiber officinale]|uniref:Retrotransposon Copia-like N-terminal domain-containing protein n=1 Tax=Zingiber officinale TaxID=94328 RepID=A0A8J5LG09_ZINOF|nr:hypothetical protein ZIOFF_024224 [Zingiber officinale]